MVEPPAIGVLLDPPCQGSRALLISTSSPPDPPARSPANEIPPYLLLGGGDRSTPPPPGSMGGNRAFLQAKEPFKEPSTGEGFRRAGKGTLRTGSQPAAGLEPGEEGVQEGGREPAHEREPMRGRGRFLRPPPPQPPHRSPLNDRILKRGQDGGAVSQQPSWPPFPPRGPLRKAPGVGTLWGWVGRERPGTAWRPSPTPPPVPRHPCRRGSEGRAEAPTSRPSSSLRPRCSLSAGGAGHLSSYPILPSTPLPPGGREGCSQPQHPASNHLVDPPKSGPAKISPPPLSRCLTSAFQVCRGLPSDATFSRRVAAPGCLAHPGPPQVDQDMGGGRSESQILISKRFSWFVHGLPSS